MSEEVVAVILFDTKFNTFLIEFGEVIFHLQYLAILLYYSYVML